MYVCIMNGCAKMFYDFLIKYLSLNFVSVVQIVLIKNVLWVVLDLVLIVATFKPYHLNYHEKMRIVRHQNLKLSVKVCLCNIKNKSKRHHN